MEQIFEFINKYMLTLHMPSIRWEDIAEIIIISFLVYQIMLWIKNTRAWSLLKGVVVIMVFILIAAIFRMTTILWIVENVLGLAVIAIIVVLQPELRRALELLGQKNILSSILPFDTGKNITGRFTDRTVNEIVKACFEMGRVKTGALIVVEQNVTLAEYERTGIPVDAILSSQLLINIFEHNTPLHDGAVIIRNNRVVSATCYLPLSDSVEIDKEMGTRHRAAVGISEVSDSLTVIVSEETGGISIARDGKIIRHLDPQGLRDELSVLREEKGQNKKFKLWKGRNRNEKKN